LPFAEVVSAWRNSALSGRRREIDACPSLWESYLLSAKQQEAQQDVTEKEARDSMRWDRREGAAHIRGFNYQPTWGRCGIEIWLKYDGAEYRRQLERGKELFPVMNTVRIWLSWSAYKFDPKQTAANVAEAIGIISDLGMLVIPVLFTRWRGKPEFDPIDMAHIDAGPFEEVFGPFLDDVVRPQIGNPGVLAWDLCNEALQVARGVEHHGEKGYGAGYVFRRQLEWLNYTRDHIRQLDDRARTCLGYMPGQGFATPEMKEQFEALGDLLTPHIYEVPDWERAEKPEPLESFFREFVKDYVDDLDSRKVHKPIGSTEACWGALTDEQRAEHVRVTLTVLKEFGIGVLPHALWCSPVADLHPKEVGPVVWPGYMAFIDPDGSMRAGHGVYNDIMP
jgi:hypothetical protein